MRHLLSILVAISLLFPGASWSREDRSQYVGDPVSMSLRDADLVETLRTFARLGDFNLILHPSVQGKVNLEFHDVPWDQALTVILQVHGLGMEMTGGTLQIASPSILRQISQQDPSLSSMLQRQTLRGTLDHVDAGLMAKVVGDPKLQFLSRYGEVEVDSESHELIVREMPARMTRVAKLVASLDSPEAAREDLAALKKRAVSLWR